jgi:hypothetical protein
MSLPEEEPPEATSEEALGETPSPLNVHQRVLKITQELGSIKKTGAAPAIMGGYAYIEHGEVMARLRTLLVEHGVSIVPTMTIVSNEEVPRLNGKNAFRVVVILKMIVVNADDPQDCYAIEWPGEGLDQNDKAIQKAGTSAEKYALMKLFKISDREDPDGTAIDEDAPPGSRGATRTTRRSQPEVTLPEEMKRLAQQVNQAVQTDRWYPKRLKALVSSIGVPEARKQLLNELADAAPDIGMSEAGRQREADERDRKESQKEEPTAHRPVIPAT